jgi:ubiquinone/menaquinone biosynthesis C-methylase UbiE
MKYHKAQAASEFTRWSESYDQSILQRLLFGPTHRAVLQRIRNRFGDRPFTALDVGCGTGNLAMHLRADFPHATVWGVDLVREMLTKGLHRWRAHSSEITPIQGDSERLPFASGAFDLVTCAHSFHHYPHQERALAEMHRVLKPGGRLLLIDGYRDQPWGWLIYDVCVAGVEGAVKHASAKQFRELVAAAGFRETVQKVHYGLAPFLITDAVAYPETDRRMPDATHAAGTPHARPRQARVSGRSKV